MNDSVGIPEPNPALLARNPQAQRWDPLTLLPALAVITSRIGHTATANTTYNELPAPLPPAAERLHRRQRLAAAFRLFSRHGFEVGLAGHFTARDPILTDRF